MAAVALTVLALVLTTSACSTKGLVFRDADTITVLTPDADSPVHLPLTVTWRLKAGVTAPSGWAVFVDRTPPGPGGALPKDRTGVTLTQQTRLTIDTLTPHTTGTREERNQHTVTVVMLDSQGRRTSEVSGYVQFEVKT